MKIYDISQEVFACAVFPGDPAPQKQVLAAIGSETPYNLSAFSMCAHNGTHVDAPYHFLKGGKTIDRLPLHKTVGHAYVTEHCGIVTAEDADAILNRAMAADKEAAKRLLIKGNATVSLEAAAVFADAKIELIGNESQTVGPEDAPMAVHLTLLGAEIVLLEGIRLQDVPEGIYFLSAAPLLLAGSDGAPCRAILIEIE